MRAPDPAQAARALINGRVKTCGLNCAADLRAARPAAFAGFVFAPGSPRQVSAPQAAPLAGFARQSGMLTVGVFRDAERTRVAETATTLNLHAVQLHAEEDENYVRSLRRELPADVEIWKAVSVGRDPMLGQGADRILFDNGDGGTGEAFDWEMIAEQPDLSRALVAGGIGPTNALAAQQTGAYAIDVGSSLDAAPGRKCPDKIAALFDALRPATRAKATICA